MENPYTRTIQTKAEEHVMGGYFVYDEVSEDASRKTQTRFCLLTN